MKGGVGGAEHLQVWDEIGPEARAPPPLVFEEKSVDGWKQSGPRLI